MLECTVDHAARSSSTGSSAFLDRIGMGAYPLQYRIPLRTPLRAPLQARLRLMLLMKDRKEGTMDMLPAPVPTVILNLLAFRRSHCVAMRLEHTLTASSNVRD